MLPGLWLEPNPPPLALLPAHGGPAAAARRCADQVTKGVQSLVGVNRAHPDLRAFKVSKRSSSIAAVVGCNSGLRVC